MTNLEFRNLSFGQGEVINSESATRNGTEFQNQDMDDLEVASSGTHVALVAHVAAAASRLGTRTESET